MNRTLLHLCEHFRDLWDRTVANGRSREAWSTLDAAYGAPERAYHNWDHIATMLADLDEGQGVEEFATVRFDEVALAIFFHDAVYDPQRQDNEARSAALLRACSGDKPLLGSEALAWVQALIEATSDHACSADPATRLLIDLDLAVLGSPPDLYATYVANVRREYGHVADALWRAGRRAVVSRFLARKRIFQTAYWHDQLETAARTNLAAELDTL